MSEVVSDVTRADVWRDGSDGERAERHDVTTCDDVDVGWFGYSVWGSVRVCGGINHQPQTD